MSLDDSILPTACYHQSMKQLITRVNEDLHEQLKARAASEDRSVNALVTELLRAGLMEGDARAQIRTRIDATGIDARPRPPRRAPSRDAAIRSTRGVGTAGSEALEAERSKR
ncbi:toxin-antitoxin system HicB family antitoxin [soil metagenome]